jgi:hypothetical protein
MRSLGDHPTRRSATTVDITDAMHNPIGVAALIRSGGPDKATVAAVTATAIRDETAMMSVERWVALAPTSIR